MKKFIVILLIWASVLYISAKLNSLYKADIYNQKAISSATKGEVATALLYSKLALERNPYEPNYWIGNAKILLTQLVFENPSNRDLIKNKVLLDLTTAQNLNVNNLVTARNVVPYYYFLSLSSNSQIPGDFIFDDKYRQVTLDYYENLKRRYSKDAGVISLIARYEKKLNDQTGYTNSVERIKILRPDLLEWHESFR